MASSSEDQTISDQSDYQTAVICDQCEGHKNVNSYCLDCKANICDTCKLKRLHREHKLLPRTHPSVANARHLAKQQCKEHPGNQYVTFCNKCKIPCCVVCISTNHKQHPFCEIEKAANEARSDLKTYAATLENTTLPTSENILKDIENNIAKYKMSIDETMDKSRMRFQSLREQLDSAEQEWTTTLQAMKTHELHGEETRKKHTGEKIEETKDLIGICKTKMAEAGDIALLLFNSVRPELDSLELETSSLALQFVEFEPSDYKIPDVSELLGKVKHGETIRRQVKRERREMKPTVPFVSDMISVTVLSEIGNVVGSTLTHTENQAWISDRFGKKIRVYDDNFRNVSNFITDFQVQDMEMTSSTEALAADFLGQSVVRISDSGNVTQVCSTVPLCPTAIHINNRKQIIVGVEGEKSNAKMQIYSMLIYSPDVSTVLREIEKDEAGKPLFSRSLLQVKQKRDGDYVVSYSGTVKCVDEEGKCKWTYCARDRRPCDIRGVTCDQYDNIIITESHNNKISLLSSDGQLIRKLLTEKDGIRLPWSLSVDKRGRLWIGQEDNVKIVKYLK